MSVPVLVFPGQGAQKVGMGKDLAEGMPEVAELFKQADRVLGIGLSQIIFEGPDEQLMDTAYQQPALVLIGLALKKAIEVKTGKALAFGAAAGLSLGEYAALAAVGALTFEDALKLTRRRGELMKAAAAGTPSGMAVILNLGEDELRKACHQAADETGGVVSPCNFNGGGQIVIGGATAALARAMELCKQAGARRVMNLPVSGAFHTALMQPAADGLREALAHTRISKARVPVYANVSALAVQEPEEIRASLEQQLTRPVLWETTIQNLTQAGHKRYLELGPGRSVGNMIRKIHPEAETEAVTNLEEVEAFASKASEALRS